MQVENIFIFSFFYLFIFLFIYFFFFSENKISGRDITPFLLKRIAELTGGESLKANIALIKNNASGNKK